MLVLRADNVNDAFRQAVDEMIHSADWIEIAPRGGARTRELLEPVATVYARPWRRVLFSELRDANPFFHLMEALWMLRGRQDAEWISQFSSKIGQYAEDNGFFHGAYGFRWRHWFDNIDQLPVLIDLLKRTPDTRRAVLAMWDPVMDLGANVRDIPCNTHVYFKIRDGKLNMTVCCRSNDLILGCYGANMVHFSVLQEYVAVGAGVRVGTYTHISDSWHYYLDNPTWKKIAAGAAVGVSDYYAGHGYTPSRVASMSIVNTSLDLWNRDLEIFFTDDWDDPTRYADLFFSRVAYPMRDAWRCYKRRDYDTANTRAHDIRASDWKFAAVEWLNRRRNRNAAKV